MENKTCKITVLALKLNHYGSRSYKQSKDNQPRQKCCGSWLDDLRRGTGIHKACDRCNQCKVSGIGEEIWPKTPSCNFFKSYAIRTNRGVI